MIGFPDLGLLRTLRPAPDSSADGGPAFPPPGLGGGKGDPGTVPRSPFARSAGLASSYAPAASHEYAAGIPRGLPTGYTLPASESPLPKFDDVVHCCPARIHQIGAGSALKGGSTTGSLALHLSASLAGPGPSGGADPSRRCQGCFPPSRVRLPSGSPACCGRPEVGPSTQPG